MKRTSAVFLWSAAAICVALGLLTNVALAASGNALLVPPITLSITLAVIGGVVVALAWPIRRAVKGTAQLRMDPFRAARTAVLAKACAIVGALFTGFAIGLLVYLLTRSVVGDAGSVWLTISAAIGGAVLLACGLIAEFFCTLPPPSDDDAESEARRRGSQTDPGHSHA